MKSKLLRQYFENVWRAGMETPMTEANTAVLQLSKFATKLEIATVQLVINTGK